MADSRCSDCLQKVPDGTVCPCQSRTKYVSDINELQTRVMRFIDHWVHQKKTIIPLKEIITNMQKEGVKKESTIYSLKILLEKGYIGRSQAISNKTFFIQYRRV